MSSFKEVNLSVKNKSDASSVLPCVKQFSFAMSAMRQDEEQKLVVIDP